MTVNIKNTTMKCMEAGKQNSAHPRKGQKLACESAKITRNELDEGRENRRWLCKKRMPDNDNTERLVRCVNAENVRTCCSDENKDGARDRC